MATNRLFNGCKIVVVVPQSKYKYTMPQICTPITNYLVKACGETVKAFPEWVICAYLNLAMLRYNVGCPLNNCILLALG